MRGLTSLIDWLDSRTGIKAGRAHLLDEPLPAGVNWWFVLGSILLFLLGLQVISGIVLAMGPGLPELRVLFWNDPDGGCLELIEAPS